MTTDNQASSHECPVCKYAGYHLRVQRENDRWEAQRQEEDVNRLLWSISLTLFAFCFTFAAPWQ